MSYKFVLHAARAMRKNPTLAEAYGWQKLRRKQFLGLKFNRQFIIRHYTFNKDEAYFIADFYCHRYRLVIEFDGDIHDKIEQKEYDILREDKLKSLGYNVIRFRNEEVLEH